nr:zinc finger, CCHC-type [Tanacetum cinerariifolium]
MPHVKIDKLHCLGYPSKVILEANELWEMIEPKEDTQVDEKKDKATTAFLYQALTEDVILQVAGCKSAKELWESLKRRHVGEEKEQSNLILEDKEPSLLMATHETEHEEVLLNEGQIQPEKYTTIDASIWYLDNGASNHMTGTKSHFRDIVESITGRIRFRDGTYVEIKGKGSILLGCRNHEKKVISDVYYIQNLKSNILSLGQLTEIGCKIIMDGNQLTLYDNNKKLLMKIERSKNRLYNIRMQIETPICLLANIDNQAWLWHARLGHLNFKDINKMTRKSLVEGIPRINHAGHICDACLLGNTVGHHFQVKLKAVRHAIYILNRVPTRALVDKTPYEALYNRKPNLENLRIFGCTAYAKITITHLQKLDDRSIHVIYLGVEEGSKAYRLYDPKGKRKHVSRDEPITTLKSPITPQTYTYNPNLEEEDATISSLKNSENGFDDTPVRGFKDLNKIYENARIVETESLLFTKEEPHNYKEASTDKKWIEAMEAELDSINKSNTWTLTTLPTNHKAIGLKWVFKTKRDAKGEIIKYKARLVAKGYVQEQGIDFNEVFAPVARIETVCLILALAAYHEWQVHHLDVKSAFLHGELKDEVYVTQPEGFIQQGSTRKVYKLSKALYGLRQAPRAWNMKLDQNLKSLDFKKCNLEQAVYTKRSKTSTLIVGVYVDDLIIMGTVTPPKMCRSGNMYQGRYFIIQQHRI